MSLITTFNSSYRKIPTLPNAAWGIALTSSIYYAIEPKVLREITFFHSYVFTDRSLLDLREINPALDFSEDDNIVFIENAYKSIIAIGVQTDGQDIVVYYVNMFNFALVRKISLGITSFDTINRYDRALSIMTGDKVSIISDAWGDVYQIQGVHTCVVDGKNIYLTLLNDTSTLCRDSLINIQPLPLVTAYFLGGPSIISNNEAIEQIAITPTSIVLISDDNYKVYDKTSNDYIGQIDNTTNLELDDLTVRSDEHGHIFYNNESTHIFDTAYIDKISTDVLNSVDFVYLQQARHIQTNANNAIIQIDNEILYLNLIEASTQIQTVTVSEAPLNTIAKGIDHGRLIEFILPISNHSIAIKCNDNTTWQNNFDLSFFVDIGYDRRLDALSRDSVVNCRLNLFVDGAPVSVLVNLTYALRSKDILSAKYNMLDYRINDSQTETLRSFIQDKNVKFDISNDNIIFEIEVKPTVRSIRAAEVHFHLLKIFRYANTSKLIITT